MKKSFLFIVIIGLAFSACKKIIVKRHTFEGILYHDDNYEPMANIQLQLILTDGSCEFGCNTYEVLKNTTTDDKGYFKFNYAHQLKDGTLKLEMKGNEQYQDEHIASGIEKNQDINMPFFRNASAYVKIRFNVLRENTVNDTLFTYPFFNGWEQVNFNIRQPNSSVNLIQVGYNLMSTNSQMITNPFKIKFDQNYEFNSGGLWFYYGVNKSNFEYILKGNDIYGESSWTLQPYDFPDTTIIDVDIH